MPTTTNKAIRLPAIGEAAWGSTLNTQTFVDIDNIFNSSGRVKPSDGGTGLDTSGSNGVPSINAGTWAINNVLTANRLLYAAASNTITSSANLTYDGTGFVVSTVGPHAIGGAIANDGQLYLRGTFAPTTSSLGADVGMFFGQTINAQAGRNAAALWLDPTLAEAASGTHDIFATLRVRRPSITAGAAALTNAASVYIQDAPTGGTNNYALWVDSGYIRFDGAHKQSGNSFSTGLLIERSDTAAEGSLYVGGDSQVYLQEANASGNYLTVDNAGVGINVAAISAQLHVVSGDAGRVGLIANTAATPTAKVQQWLNNGTEWAFLNATNSISQFSLPTNNLGNNVAGPSLRAERNSNAGAESGAAGTLAIAQANGTAAYIWQDNAGNVRTNSAAPTGSAGTPTVSDTAGTVVGTQTSWHELKENIILAQIPDYENALQAVLVTPLYHFDLKADGKRRLGYVIYEEDRKSWFSHNDGRQQIPTLDERALFGYHAAAIKALHARIATLEGEVVVLRAKLIAGANIREEELAIPRRR